MSASKNWPCFGDDGTSIAALTSGSTTAQIVDTAYERAAEDVMVYNVRGGHCAEHACAAADAVALSQGQWHPHRDHRARWESERGCFCW